MTNEEALSGRGELFVITPMATLEFSMLAFGDVGFLGRLIITVLA